MDFVNKLTGGSKDGEDQKQKEQTSQKQENSGGGIMDKLNGLAGGGKESEKNEDALDKGLLVPIASYISIVISPPLTPAGW